MNKITLYAYNFRSRAERVLWTLDELALPYELIRLDPKKGETRSETFLALNASAKIPVLTHGDKVLTESVAIMEYLNDISAEIKLIPNTTEENLKYRTVMSYGLTEIEPYLWIAEQARRLKGLYNWPEGTYEEAFVQINNNIPLVWKWLEEREYIAGDEFTLADIYFYHFITWMKQHEFDLPEIAGLYLKKLEKRTQFSKDVLSL